MEDFTKEDVARELVLIGRLYNKDMDDELVDYYLEILDELSYSSMIEALGYHLRDRKRGQRFPLPCDVLYQFDMIPAI